jgi:hypothetical protein
MDIIAEVIHPGQNPVEGKTGGIRLRRRTGPGKAPGKYIGMKN